MQQIETKDIQGIVIRGYSELPAACFVMLTIGNAAQARAWLKHHLQLITPGNAKPTHTALNVAFTYQGLKTLGLDQASLETFPLEFEDGMTTRHKQDLLGDYGTSAPDKWLWGQKGNTDTHIMLMLYASNSAALETFYNEITSDFPSAGMQVLKKLDTTVLEDRKEHFGFHDGIAQPTIKGLGRVDTPANTIAAGEFIMGYENEYDQYTESPKVPANLDKVGILERSQEDPHMKDLGKNGTYIVFRQLEQNVEQFWSYMDSKTQNTDGSCNPHEMIKLASKMVGRWPSGAPVVTSPDKDNEAMENKDNFGYRHHDKDGMKCPFASHVRRSNPRDSIDTTPEASVKIANKHRILRRGRSYGTPVVPDLDPMEIIKKGDMPGERGLYFICINADINRQFEFIQNFWVNNPKFGGLFDERDPLTGNHSHPASSKQTGTFSIPANPVRQRLTDVPEFVTVKGGAYFFLPGMKALQFLTSI